jgi:ATP-dependent Clp protease ATP-binding subunit ClpA
VDPKTSRHLYKYFARADRFVRVRVLDPRRDRPTFAPSMDGSAWRRAVVGACVEDATAYDGAALEELYLLSVAVNPHLDLSRVELAAEAGPIPQRSRRGSRVELCARLRRRARGIEERLTGRLVGQAAAVAAVAGALRRAAAGLAEEGRPLATLLFVGRTGTGKTELARSLAEELGGPDRLVKIDCSEYGEGHETSRLTGAPPGYVGHGDGGYLVRALARCGEAVVLFDEVEKAHPRLADLLLQVLDEGRLTDGRGESADLSRSFVVLTSNAGARELERAGGGLGFTPQAPDAQANGEIVRAALARAFRPEFLGRLDQTVLFRDLNEGDAIEIARRRLAELALRVRRAGGRVRISPTVARWVAQQGFSSAEGARGIAHAIRREIEAPLAEALLAREGGWIELRMRGGRPILARAA